MSGAWAALAVALFAGEATAAARVVVHPGESIQAAIDAAAPDSTIVVEPGMGIASPPTASPPTRPT